MRMLRNSRIFIIFVLALAIGTLAASCGGDKETSPRNLVPEGSNLISEVNLAAILASPGLATSIDAVPKSDDDPQSLDELLDEAYSETGIDIRQVSQLVFFRSGFPVFLSHDGENSSQAEPLLGIIVKSALDEAVVIAAMEKMSGPSISTSDYKGRSVYRPEVDGEELFQRPALAFLDGDILVLGTAGAVQAVIDVQEGDRDRLSGPVRDAFNGLGSGLVRMQLDVSSLDLEGMIPLLEASVEVLPGVLNELLDVNLLGLSLTQNGQILVLRVNLDFANEDSAATMGDLLEGLIKVASGLVPNEAAKKLLGLVEVSRNKARLTLRLEAPASLVAELASNLADVSSSERSEMEPITPERRIAEIPSQPVELGREVPIMPTRRHVPEGQQVDYSTRPPTSGDHWGQWARCGFYEDGLPDERITHNLEHGNVVVSYNLASQSQVNDLREVMDSIPPAADWGVARFYDQIPRGTVVLAVWGRHYALDAIDRDQIARFFDEYAEKLGPERISCETLSASVNGSLDQ